MAKRGRPRHPDVLTPREWEVLSLIRGGLTNEQIAERIGVSIHAVRYHVSQILSKLGVTTREEPRIGRREATSLEIGAGSGWCCELVWESGRLRHSCCCADCVRRAKRLGERCDRGVARGYQCLCEGGLRLRMRTTAERRGDRRAGDPTGGCHGNGSRSVRRRLAHSVFDGARSLPDVRPVLARIRSWAGEGLRRIVSDRRQQ